MTTIVIGAGWAGLAAAVHLTRAGRHVTLFEAAPQAGGRARELELEWGDATTGLRRIVVDNGQHLLIGAYSDLLDLLRLIGRSEQDSFRRSPIALVDTAGLRLSGAGLGALIAMRGLGWRARFDLLRTLAPLKAQAASVSAGAADAGAFALPGETVADWWHRSRQSTELVEKLWRPLCLSALNTPADQACARAFGNVLRDSMAGPAGASDFLLPRTSLGEAFVAPVLAWLEAQGARLVVGAEVRRIEPIVQTARGFRLSGPASHRNVLLVDCERLVIATPPGIAARLLADLAPPALLEQLGRFEHLPITTVYCGWPAHDQSLRARMDAMPVATLLRDDPARGRHGQWFFRRELQHGLLIGAIVISDSRVAMALPRAELQQQVAQQLVAELGLPAPAHLAVVSDKRATIACSPGRPRLHAGAAGLPGLALAGDYLYPDYPATLESALRSGRLAARHLVDHQIAAMA